MKKTILLFAGLALMTMKTQAQTVTDIDNNVYNTVTIGTQTWMKENLKVTHYRNGTLIPNVTDTAVWSNLVTSARCYYNNDSVLNAPVYGAIYNWYAVDDSTLCPIGWHVATDYEWTTLIAYLGGDSVAGGKLKETGIAHWQSPNAGATNTTGFTALGGGYRRFDGVYDNMGHDGYWWTSTAYSADYSWNMNIRKYDSTVLRQHFGKNYGQSVRCVKGKSMTQINEINYQKEIKIYPNPFTDRVYIDCADRQNLKMQIYNVIGDCVFQSVMTSGTNEIDICSLTTGVYVIQLTGADGTFQRKLIKE